MSYHPRCWHCTHPAAYWLTVIVLSVALLATMFWVVTLMLFAMLALAVLYANLSQRVWAVIR